MSPEVIEGGKQSEWEKLGGEEWKPLGYSVGGFVSAPVAGYDWSKLQSDWAIGSTYTFGGSGTATWSPEPDESWRCPHCQRDWHVEPLRQAVATMWDTHKFDLNYDPDTDESVIECVGSDVYGPPRAKVTVSGHHTGMYIDGLISSVVGGTLDALGLQWHEPFPLVVPFTAFTWLPGDDEPEKPISKALAVIEETWEFVQQLTQEIPTPDAGSGNQQYPTKGIE